MNIAIRLKAVGNRFLMRKTSKIKNSEQMAKLGMYYILWYGKTQRKDFYEDMIYLKEIEELKFVVLSETSFPISPYIFRKRKKFSPIVMVILLYRDKCIFVF